MPENNADSLTSSESSEELQRQIHFLQDPFGDEAHLRQQERAVRYLLAHPDQAHPRLLALLTSNRASNPFAVIEVLPRFGRPESVPILADILAHGPPNLSQAAGEALARHPLDSAGEALLHGLRLPRSESVSAAADGLMTRGDRAACPALLEVLDHPDPDVRYHLIQAAGQLGCLEAAALSDIVKGDPDSDIRALAARLMQNLR